MNILIYSKWFFPVPGGVQTVVKELAAGLVTQHSTDKGDQINVIVVTGTARAGLREEAYSFELVRRPGLLRFIRLMSKADIVHLAGPAFWPLIIALVLTKPVVIEHHGFQAVCPNGLLLFEPTESQCPGHFMAAEYKKCFQCNRASAGSTRSLVWLLATPMRRFLSNRATANVAPTDWLGKILGLNRTTTIHHGVADMPQLAGETCNSTFAFQGRLVSSKGVRVLLSAAKRLAAEGYEFRIKIIGDGAELDGLKVDAAGLDGRIEFLGHLPLSDLENALSDVRTIVMPSLGGEVFGLVAAENMARGKMLIVSRIGALEEVVGNTGLVCEAGKEDDLAARMRETLGAPERTRLLGIAARDRAQSLFTSARMIGEHVRLYERILNRTHKQPRKSGGA